LFPCHAGHLMCAEAGPGIETAACSVRERAMPGAPKCPSCRMKLARNPIRVLSAEQSIAALPKHCRDGDAGSTRGEVLGHEAQCPRAPARCAADGCGWDGLSSERDAHEATCAWGRATPRHGVLIRALDCLSSVHPYIL
jgi:hypothetical protein